MSLDAKWLKPLFFVFNSIVVPLDEDSIAWPIKTLYSFPSRLVPPCKAGLNIGTLLQNDDTFVNVPSMCRVLRMPTVVRKYANAYAA